MDPYQRYLENEQAKEAAMTQAATGAGASALAASTLAGFNWPGLIKSAAPNILGPLGVLAGMAIPGKLNNPQANPNWRQQPQQSFQPIQGYGIPQDTPFQQEEDTSIVGQMKRNAGYRY